jgi:uncharacterized protein YdhG (YjbR/CyaY superfamily)
MNTTQKSAKNTNAKNKTFEGLAEGERAAIKERVQELKAASHRGQRGADGEREVLAKIAAMPEPYPDLGERLHAVIRASAPALLPKTWYGLPAYTKDGKVVCYLRMNPKPPYNDRYMTFGFNEAAQLDEGAMWPTAFAVQELTAAEEARIGALVKKAVR